jgi:hypothetical protein
MAGFCVAPARSLCSSQICPSSLASVLQHQVIRIHKMHVLSPCQKTVISCRYWLNHLALLGCFLQDGEICIQGQVPMASVEMPQHTNTAFLHQTPCPACVPLGKFWSRRWMLLVSA